MNLYKGDCDDTKNNCFPIKYFIIKHIIPKLMALLYGVITKKSMS